MVVDTVSTARHQLAVPGLRSRISSAQAKAGKATPALTKAAGSSGGGGAALRGSLVPLYRANNLAIMLVQFGRMRPEQITAAISRGDPDDVLPLEKLLLLMQVAPTEVRTGG